MSCSNTAQSPIFHSILKPPNEALTGRRWGETYIFNLLRCFREWSRGRLLDLPQKGLNIHRRCFACGLLRPASGFAGHPLLALISDDLVEVLLCEIERIERHEGCEIGWGFGDVGHSNSLTSFFAMKSTLGGLG